MNNRFLVCNVGWMESYEGVGLGKTIHGGGTFVAKQGWGSEIYNFKPHKGRFYGGLFPGRYKRRYKGIRIEKLGAQPTHNKINSVTVIWTARRPKTGGTYVVGWYENATVYRKEQPAPVGSARPIPKRQGESCGYYIEAEAKDCKPLESDLRTVLVPRG